MKYNVGDIFLDIRGKQKRIFLITEVIVDGVEPLMYRFYISPDSKEDVYTEYMLKYYIDKHVFIHYPLIC
jgi:hypothetical protein